MLAKILDGKVVRDEIADNLRKEISRLRSKIKLVIIQVGDNPQSNTYISQKIKFGEKIGALVEHKKFPADVTEQTLNSQISSLNSDVSVHGIILQMPIPENLDKERLINTIDPKKDVDGLTNVNTNLLNSISGPVILGSATTPESVINKDSGPFDETQGKQARMTNFQGFIPATPKGVLSLLKFYGIDPKGKKVTVVGRSKLVGAPLATLLRNLGAEVTVGHSQTPNLTAITKPAQIIIVAVGRPNLITKNHISPGQVIIDVGINVAEEKGQALAKSDTRKGLTLNQAAEPEPSTRHLTGDVAFEEVSQIVAAITPVPGGIGPMTVASLFENLLEACKKQLK